MADPLDDNPFARALQEMVGHERAGKLIGSPDPVDNPAPITSDETVRPRRALKSKRGASRSTAVAALPFESTDVQGSDQSTKDPERDRMIGSILDSVGLDARRDDQEKALQDALLERGHSEVRVTGVRWATATVEASAVAAQMLRLDQDQVLELARTGGAEGLNRMRIKVAG